MDRLRSAQHLDLFSAQRLRFKGGRLFHCHEGEQLQEVVLNDVSGRADSVIIASAAAKPNIFGHGDLHVVDIVRVPHRLKNLVSKPQRHDVLHGLFTQVVIDAEDSRFWEDRVDDLIELARRFLVVAKRLFDDHSAPRVLHGIGHAHAFQLVADIGEKLWRHRKVVCPVASRAAGFIQLGQPRRKLVEALIVEGALHELDSLG